MKTNPLRIIALLGAILIAGITLPACGNQSTRTPQNKVKVGVIMPLSGPLAYCGLRARTGIEIALEEFGGSSPIEVIYEDSEFVPRIAVTAYHKLVGQNGLKFIIGACNSSSTLALAPLAEENKVLLMTPASGSDAISDAGEYVFRTSTSTKLEASKTAEFILKMGWKRVSMLHINNDYGAAYLANLKEFLAGTGVLVITSEAINTSEHDYRSRLVKIRGMNIDVIVVSLALDSAADFFIQRYEMGIDIPIVSGRTLERSDLVDTVGKDATEGVYLISPTRFIRDDLVKKIQEKERDERFVVLEIVGGYDAAKAISWVVEQCGPDPVCAKDKLLQIDYAEGAVGPLRFDEKGDAMREMSIKIFRDGNLAPYEN